MASGKGGQDLSSLFGMSSMSGDAVIAPAATAGERREHLGAALSLPVMVGLAIVALYMLREWE